MKSLLDRSFQYIPSVETDLRKTFARVRRQLKADEEARVVAESELEKERAVKVKPFIKLKG